MTARARCTSTCTSARHALSSQQLPLAFRLHFNKLFETNGGNLYGKRTNSRSEDRRSADTPELGASDHRLSAAPGEFDRLDGSQPAREPHRGGGEDRRRFPAADRPFHGERQNRVEQAAHRATAEGP